MKNLDILTVTTKEELSHYKKFVKLFKKECLLQREERDKMLKAEGYIYKRCPKCGDEFFDHKNEQETLCYEDRYYAKYPASWNLENAIRRRKELQIKFKT